MHDNTKNNVPEISNEIHNDDLNKNTLRKDPPPAGICLLLQS